MGGNKAWQDSADDERKPVTTQLRGSHSRLPPGCHSPMDGAASQQIGHRHVIGAAAARSPPRGPRFSLTARLASVLIRPAATPSQTAYLNPPL